MSILLQYIESSFPLDTDEGEPAGVPTLRSAQAPSQAPDSDSVVLEPVRSYVSGTVSGTNPCRVSSMRPSSSNLP